MQQTDSNCTTSLVRLSALWFGQNKSSHPRGKYSDSTHRLHLPRMPTLSLSLSLLCLWILANKFIHKFKENAWLQDWTKSYTDIHFLPIPLSHLVCDWANSKRFWFAPTTWQHADHNRIHILLHSMFSQSHRQMIERLITSNPEITERLSPRWP